MITVNPTILALDLGKASVGLCLRDNEQVLELESYLIPADFATVSDLRSRKVACRTRKAHHQRESWFMEAIWLKAGLPDFREPTTWEPLKATLPQAYANDKKLWTREFPAKGDSKGDATCFNSALLRIKLLEGEPLTDWQLWKALWSALQQRGFHYYNWKDEPKDLFLEPEKALQEQIDAVKAGIDALQIQINAEKVKLKEATSKKEKELQQEFKDRIAELTEQKKQLEQDETFKELQKVLPKLEKFQELINTKVGEPQYRYPCYLEAANMGLWEPTYSLEKQAGITHLRINNNASTMSKEEQLVPRAYRLKELKALWEQATQQRPQLAGFSTSYFLYGETELPYATAWVKDPAIKRQRGKATLDWQGVLGQKVPRFDNRIIAKCQLLPTRNVCKANDPLNLQHSLLTQLKHLRYLNGSSEIQSLSPIELKAMFEALWDGYIQKQIKANSKEFGVAYTFLNKALRENVPGFKAISNLNHREKLKLNGAGRSRFSRPALHLMKSFLLGAATCNLPADKLRQELTPADVINEEAIAAYVANGLSEAEVNAALKRLGKNWSTFTVLDRRYEEKTESQRDEAITRLIASSNNPIVRHRLTVILNKLKDLDAVHHLRKQPPGKVILEFVRGVDSSDVSFEGRKKTADFQKAINENEKRNDSLWEDLVKAGLTPSKTNLLKLKLHQEQKGLCVYSGTEIKLDQQKMLEACDIDHIVPTSETIHSDAVWNKVLVLSKENRTKGPKTPYEWLKNTDRWEAYSNRVNLIYKDGHKKKKELLLSPEARQKAESYNGLAETSYIARLVREMMILYFGYKDQTEGDNRNVFVNDGSMTAAIRKRYGMNAWLLTPEQEEELEDLRYKQQNHTSALAEERQAWRARIKELSKKQRSNDKHHALDAFCVSLSQSIHREPESPLYPEGYWEVNKALITRLKPLAKQHLDALFPTGLRRNTKELYPEETIYRYNAKHNAMTVRKSLSALLENDKDGKAMKKIVDAKLRHYLEQKRLEITDKAQWREFLNPERFAKQDEQGNYLEDPKLWECRHPIFKSVVKKVEVIASELSTPPVVAKDGLRVAGEYKDYGTKATQGQFKRTKQHKGQLLYKDFKGKWRVYPVYGYMKLSEAKRQAQAKGELYKEGMLFYSSATVVLPVAAKDGSIPEGRYKLRTIMTAGGVKLEAHNGQEFLLSVDDLAKAKAEVLL